MALLHLTGTPLAATQRELTTEQRAFLVAALPDALAWVNRAGRGGDRGGRRPAARIDGRLRAEVERRRREAG